MNKIVRLLIVFLLSIPLNLFCGMSLSAASAPNNAENTSPLNLMDQETKYSKEKAEYLQQYVLDKIIGPGKAVVIVEIELGLETKVTRQAAAEQKNEKKKRLNDMEFLLPGVPNPKSVTNEAAPGESKQESGEATKTTFETKTVIKKQVVTVLHDDKIQKEKLDTVKEAINVSMKIDVKRGDKIEFKKTKFVLGFWDRMMEPYVLVPTVLSLLLLFFLFGPLTAFFRSYVRTLREKGGTEVTVDSKFAGGKDEEGEGGDGKGGKGGGGGGIGSLADMEGFENEKKKYIPFKYVDDDNLKRLIFLIRKETPQYIALVVSYLKPEYVKEILSALNPQLQAQVAVEMATIRQMTQDQVKRIDEELKEKVDFLIGGLDHLLKVIDQVDKGARDNILEYLKEDKPELYEKVKKFIITFDDIPTFPDQAMQTIIRELRSDSIAKALRDAPVDILNKFFANMSANAAAVLKEEMEYGRPLTPEEIEEERRKILDTIKQLERDVKIFIREKPKNVILEGSQEVVSGIDMGGGSAGSATGDANFNEYFTAGTGFYEAGQYQEAINYFEYCAQLNPNDGAVQQYLGNSLFASGRVQEAIAAFEKALEINPNDQGLKDWLAQQKQRA